MPAWRMADPRPTDGLGRRLGRALSTAAAVGMAALAPLRSLPAVRLETGAAAAATAAATAALMPSPALALHARYTKKTVTEKLAQVPVFAVTNESGQPYLATMDKGFQVGLIFFDPDDAVRMLHDLKKSSGADAADARVFIMGLDRAFEMVKSKPQPSGLRGPRGDELRMVFRFYPSQRQTDYARAIARKNKQPPVDGVPCFVGKGLTLRKGKEHIIPLFLDKRDLDEAWRKLRDSMPELPKEAEVEVGDLVDVILRMQEVASGGGGGHKSSSSSSSSSSISPEEAEDLKRVALFPPSRSVEFMKQEQAKQYKGTARMHAKPS